ncbi:hypothetical protein [Flavobacterium sp. 25HG05S-40]|uniref:hypothetical protein n=1 Tax=Flavobacterium sp. 25HG05S-40 TaxID=3458682 RepID=UPI004043A556
MYSEDTIESLSNRIGFGLPLESGFPFQLEEANSVGSSGRFFKAFHQLVTVENIFAATPDLEESDAEDTFNDILTGFRFQAASFVIPLIMDKNKQYNNTVDYDQIITDNIVLFDDALGYKAAMMVLEYLMATKESNLTERNAKLAISNLKLELEGFRNDGGVLVASGLVQKFNKAVSIASEKIFPIVPTVDSKSVW